MRKRVLLALGWYDPQIHAGVARFAREAGWIVDSSMRRTGRVPAYWRGDGILTLTPYGEAHKAFRRKIDRLGVPVADFQRTLLPGGKWREPPVRADHGLCGRIAAEHLMSRGLVHLAYARLAPTWSSEMRREGFEAAVTEAGLPRLAVDLFPGGKAGPLGVEGPPACADDRRDAWLIRQLRALPKPCGLMAPDDAAGAWVLRACAAAGLRVPQDVAVIGEDNDALTCEFTDPPLSSVDGGLEEEGYQMAKALAELMAGKPRRDKPLLVRSCRVVARASTAVLAHDHPALRAALGLIEAQFRKPSLTPAAIASATGVSARHLHSLFLEHAGESVSATLERHRLAAAVTLLASLDAKLVAIARQCGFSSALRLHRACVRAHGVAPGALRKAGRG